MSRRSEARLVVQYPQAATLGNVVGQVIADLANPSAAAPLDRRDRRRLLIFTNVLASARRGGEPLDQLITAREQARRHALDRSDDPDEAIGVADELPSVDEDRTNYDLMAKVLLEPDQKRHAEKEKSLVEFLGEAESAVRNLARMGRVDDLKAAERAIVTEQLPGLLERMSHINDDFDRPDSPHRAAGESATGMPVG